MTTTDIISSTLSLIAIFISMGTLYLVNYKKGKIKCGKPIQYFFGYNREDKSGANISINLLIYSTAISGQVVEQLFMEIEQGESKQTFNNWFAGTTASNRLKTGGFKVPRDGISLDFIFNTPNRANSFRFSRGNFTARLYAKTIGSRKPQVLIEENFTLNETLFNSIDANELAVFELGSNGQNYHGYPDQYTQALAQKIPSSIIRGEGND